MSRNARRGQSLQPAITFLIAGSIAACSPAVQSAPPADPEPPPLESQEPPAKLKKGEPPVPEIDRHIEDARAEIASAERVIQQSLAPAGPTPPVVVDPKGPNGGKAPDPRPPPAELRGCQPACAALASMRRSGEYVCRLAGAGDEKCIDARTRLRSAEARVTAAQCPCAGPSS